MGGCSLTPIQIRFRVLNHTGLFIWKLCDGNHGLANVLDALREGYEGIPEEQVDHQVKDFMDEMVANGFIGLQTSETA